MVKVDSMSLFFPHQGWGLVRPARVSLGASQVAFLDTLRLRGLDGSGDVSISGSLPGDTPGKLDATVRGLDLLSVFGVVYRDSTALDGIGSLDLHLAGTREAPTFNGNATVISPVSGDAHFPTVMATFDYANERLHSDVSLWRTGLKVLNGSATLPLDLALAARDVRKLPGELQIAAAADSVDMVILEALLPGVTKPSGAMRLDLKGSGTWTAPTLEGVLAIQNGAMSIPSLNVRYAPINALAHFVKDSLADRFDGGGQRRRLSYRSPAECGSPNSVASRRWTCNLDAHDFLAIDAPAFLTMRATGDVLQLTGPLTSRCSPAASVQVSRSVLYFADLVTKNVIDLEDPENAALIDTTALRRRGLGNEFSTKFLDSLRIRGPQLPPRQRGLAPVQRGQHPARRTRCRSTRRGRCTNLSGTLNAPRGTYTAADRADQPRLHRRSGDCHVLRNHRS